jgi:hypothetical protein
VAAVKGKAEGSQKGFVKRYFMMRPVRHPFSAFAPENSPLLRENQYNHVRFDSLNPPFHYPRTHYSTIPAFQYSNLGEAPKFLTPVPVVCITGTNAKEVCYA